MMDDGLELDALLAEAAVTPMTPSAALTARILSDAATVQPQALVHKSVFVRKAASVRESAGIFGWLAGLADDLGGPRALIGLSFAGLTGLFVGVAEPEALQSLTTLLAGDTAQIAQMDLLPAADTLWTEN